ncbi:MAG TPA: globin domain-containing protein [Thermoanaerobaculia bacterium]|nr:globin domain-containing protein [Thermoanaerobaculia bacterium]
MTPEQRMLVKETFPDIRQIAIPVSLLFYGRLFDLDPSLRALFHIDMTEQSEKLMSMLDAIVGSLDSFEEMRPVLRELGQRHVEYGVKESHYATLGSALVWAFAQALEPNFNDSVREAWGAVLGEVSREMLAGAAEGPPLPPA